MTKKYPCLNHSILSGIASTFNLQGNYFSNFEFETDDSKALASDWIIVGHDLNQAMESFKENHNKRQLELKFDE